MCLMVRMALRRRGAGIPIGGYWYYFDSYGIMKTGLQTIAGSLYYLGDSNDGSMRRQAGESQWQWYYLNGSGAALTGLAGGGWYYFENDHVSRK